MARPIEKALIAVTLAGIALVLTVSRSPESVPGAGGSSGMTVPGTTVAMPSTVAHAPDPPSSATTGVRSAAGVPAGARASATAADVLGGPEPAVPETVPPPPLSATTTSVAAAVSSLAAPTTAPVPPGAPVTSTAPSATLPATSSTTAPRVPEGLARCASVEELWRWDGLPVEDSCTLAEVGRVMRWAWTGTDEQRRSAIRNGYLLDEVFAALDDMGREIGAGVFHPETRGEWTIRFDNIRWHGGPEFDRAVIAADYSFHHPDYLPGSWRTVTLVQIDGEWKLSYRRSFCRMVTPSLEHHGSDVRCPPDPHPDVNEEEYPDVIEEF